MRGGARDGEVVGAVGDVEGCCCQGSVRGGDGFGAGLGGEEENEEDCEDDECIEEVQCRAREKG